MNIRASIFFVLTSASASLWAQDPVVNVGPVVPTTPPPEVEEVLLHAPIGGMQMHTASDSLLCGFELLGEKALFLDRGTTVEIPIGAQGFSVFGGLASYTLENKGGEELRHFRFGDTKVPLFFQVQGHRFAMSAGGVFKVCLKNGALVDFETVGVVNDGVAVSSVTVLPGSNVASTPVLEEPLSTVELLKQKLYSAPAEPIVIRSSTLPQVFTMLAKLARVSFLYSGPAGVAASNVSGTAAPVTGSALGSGQFITTKAFENPFRLLEIIAAENGYVVEPVGLSDSNPNGVWTLRSFAREGLVARTYRVKYNHASLTKDSSGGGMGSSAASGATAQAAGGSAGSSGYGNVGAAERIFQSDSGQLAKDVDELLKMTDRGLVVSGETDFRKSDAELDRELDRLGGVPKLRQLDGSQTETKARVLYSERTNTLFVVATRQQHEWVRGYLRAVDQPQRNILLEIKLVETTKSPTENYGIKWPSSIKMDVASRNGLSPASSESGTTEFDASEHGLVLNPGPGIAGGFPLSGVITADQLAVTISALKEDAQGHNIKYLYTATPENREVVMNNVVLVPVKQASLTTSNGAATTGSSSSQVDIVPEPVGTKMNIRPVVVGDDSVFMDLSLEISAIAGYDQIDGEPYMRKAVRAHKGAVTVRSGESLAIGGLDEQSENTSWSKVPLLGDIPLLGKLFTSKTHQKPQTHLLIFVTPLIQTGYSSGVESFTRGVTLGDWNSSTHYVQGSVSTLADLRREASGLNSYVNQVEQMFRDRSLNSSFASDVNGLLADINGLLADCRKLSTGVTLIAEDLEFQRQLVSQRDRVNRVRVLLAQSRK